jgi:hypothetical protein
MVKKLVQQRRRTGEIGARHHRSGRKPMILAAHQRQMRALLGKKPDLTLKGTAGGRGAGMLTARHSLRAGEDGADI